jgi:hypothetical protein
MLIAVRKRAIFAVGDRARSGCPASLACNLALGRHWFIVRRSTEPHIPHERRDRWQLHTTTGAWQRRRDRGGSLPIHSESIGRHSASGWPRSCDSWGTSSHALGMDHGSRHGTAHGRQSPVTPVPAPWSQANALHESAHQARVNYHQENSEQRNREEEPVRFGRSTPEDK